MLARRLIFLYIFVDFLPISLMLIGEFVNFALQLMNF